MLGATKLDHVGFVTAGAEHPLARLLGGVGNGVRMPSGVEVTRLGPAGQLELVRPVRPPTPVDRFLSQHGPGLHHVAIRIGSSLGRLAPTLEAAGFPAVTPVEPSSDGRPSLFLDPRSTGGVLVELVEERT